MAAFDIVRLKSELIEDEGIKPRAYLDSLGNTTIGIGRNLTGADLSQDEIDLLWVNDIRARIILLDRHVPWWRNLTPARQRVMINLCFNLGWAGLSGFKKFLAAMQCGDWPTAAAELQDSVWWGQVADRGPRMVQRLLTETT